MKSAAVTAEGRVTFSDVLILLDIIEIVDAIIELWPYCPNFFFIWSRTEYEVGLFDLLNSRATGTKKIQLYEWNSLRNMCKNIIWITIVNDFMLATVITI